MPHIGDIIANKLVNLAGYLTKLTESPNEAAQLGKALKALSSGDMPTELARKLASEQGIHLVGHQSLSRGAILTGLIWGAMTALLIDGRHLRASLFALAGMLLSLVGFIHARSLGFHYDLSAVWGYALMAILFAATYKLAKKDHR